MTQDHTKAIDEAFLELGDLSMAKSVLRKLVAKVTQPESEVKSCATTNALAPLANSVSTDGTAQHARSASNAAPFVPPEGVPQLHADLVARGESVLRGDNVSSENIAKRTEAFAACSRVIELLPLTERSIVLRALCVIDNVPIPPPEPTPSAEDGPTPETDTQRSPLNPEHVHISFARSLERRLLASQWECDRLTQENLDLHELLQREQETVACLTPRP